MNLELRVTNIYSRVSEHVKNYRPKLLLLSGPPSSRPSLMHFANLITKKLSLLICSHIETVRLNDVTFRGLPEALPDLTFEGMAKVSLFLDGPLDLY